MKTLGIIAEYNPFHNGHKYHIETARKKSGADIVVAIISGGFNQRGEPCVNDKWTRAKWALNNGADLVLELPVLYATSNAGDFARGGIKILEALGVDYISFGTESHEDTLFEIKDLLENKRETIDDLINLYKKEGISFPLAREKAIGQVSGKDFSAFLQQPNNILAIEYLNNMSDSKPIIVKREGTGYKGTEIEGLPSATAIRLKASMNEDIHDYVPEDVDDIINVDINKLWEMAALKAMNLRERDIDNIYSADKGFGNLLKKQIRYTSNYDSLIETLNSKRYTKSRIKRFVLQLILNITREEMALEPLYARVLGFNNAGSEFLKASKKQSIPIITNVNKCDNLEGCVLNSLSMDIRANDIYNLIVGRDLYQYSDYIKMPVIIKK